MMDSESSLLLCFYDRQTDWSNQLREIKNKFSKSVIVGCSGAVENTTTIANGELSPQGANTCELHNQTMTVTLIQETA